MTQLISCWNVATSRPTWQMYTSRVWRLNFGYEADAPFDPDRRLTFTDLTAREAVALAYKYRIRLLPCLDCCFGESPNTYHRRPHELDPAKLEAYFRPLLVWLRAQDLEPVYAGQLGNEVDFAPWLSRPPRWSENEPLYESYRIAFSAMEGLFGEFFPDAPFAVGGRDAIYHGGKPGREIPPLNLWMGENYPGAAWLDYHPSYGEGPDAIAGAVRELRRRTGKTVAIFEDVYQDTPGLLSRAGAAASAGAVSWAGWFGWPEALTSWRSGAGIAPDVYDQPWDEARASELVSVSRAFDRFRPDLIPRGGVAVPQPQPEPEPTPEPAPPPGPLDGFTSEEIACGIAAWDALERWNHFAYGGPTSAKLWSDLTDDVRARYIRKLLTAEAARTKL